MCWSVDFIFYFIFCCCWSHWKRTRISRSYGWREFIVRHSRRLEMPKRQRSVFRSSAGDVSRLSEPTLSIMHGNPRKKRKSLLFVYISLWQSLYSLFKSLWFYQVPFSQICGVRYTACIVKDFLFLTAFCMQHKQNFNKRQAFKWMYC